MTDFRPVYIPSLERWAVEVEFENGLEFLVAVEDDRISALYFQSDGTPTFTPIDTVVDAFAKAQELIAKL